MHEAAQQFARDGITLDELDRLEREETRVSIVDGQLYGAAAVSGTLSRGLLHELTSPSSRPAVKTFHGEWTSRSFAILASLNEAVRTSPDVFPDVEFVFRCV